MGYYHYRDPGIGPAVMGIGIVLVLLLCCCGPGLGYAAEHGLLPDSVMPPGQR